MLLKIQAHYVESPRWRELLDRGTADFEVALAEPAFQSQNLPERDRPAVEQFRHDLRAMLATRTINSRTDAGEAVAAVAALAEQRLELRPTAAVLEYFCGAANGLDPYSAYLTPDQLGEVYSQIEGNFVGLGIELKTAEGELVIVRVITGSPAEQAGLRLDDRILAVDGRAAKAMQIDQAANMLQGREGTTVALWWRPRPAAAVDEHSPPADRGPQRRQGAILDRQYGIGCLRLTCFQKTTRRDMDTALWQLHRDGMKRLIIDLRGNPGGLLLTAVEVVEMFVDRGVIVSTRGRNAAGRLHL